MAGGQSPRQKMINLMYLVFIAMLALNMSKEVLSAFGLLNEKIATANVETTKRNTALMDGLATKANDEPEQYAALKAKAEQISTASDELDTYLEGLKAEAIKDIEDPKDYEVMDKADFFNNLFFTGGTYKPEGEEFLSKLNAYRSTMMEVLPDSTFPNIKRAIADNFSTAPVTNRDGVEVEWLNYNYEGYPLVASLTKLTQIQADVKTTKSEVLQRMLAGQQAQALSFTNYNTFMDVPKSAFYSGETFNGAILLGRTDASTVPQEVKLTLDGRPLTKEQYSVQGGRVVLNVGAGSPGDHKIEGMLVYGEGGEKVEVEVNTGFATISKPNSAVIAADKMNVVYRGVDNPITVSIPGIPDNNVSASGAGLSKVSGSKYVMRPQTGTSVTITASGTLPDGQKVSSQAPFRIKGIPAPVGTIRGESGIVRMQRGGLEISSVGALLEDFDFDLNLRVTGFSFKVSGQPTIVVSGTKLNGAAQAALRRAKRGDAVQIFDINTSISGSDVKLRKTAPVVIELTN